MLNTSCLSHKLIHHKELIIWYTPSVPKYSVCSICFSLVRSNIKMFDQIFSLIYKKNILTYDLVRFASTCTFAISTFYIFLLIRNWRYWKSKVYLEDHAKRKQILYYGTKEILLLPSWLRLCYCYFGENASIIVMVCLITRVWIVATMYDISVSILKYKTHMIFMVEHWPFPTLNSYW